VLTQSIHWNYTTVLNLVFFAVTAVLLVRFFRTGGRQMLAMMGGDGEHHEDRGDAAHEHAGHHG
jgi:hypothetical protein